MFVPFCEILMTFILVNLMFLFAFSDTNSVASKTNFVWLSAFTSLVTHKVDQLVANILKLKFHVGGLCIITFILDDRKGGTYTPAPRFVFHLEGKPKRDSGFAFPQKRN